MILALTSRWKAEGRSGLSPLFARNARLATHDIERTSHSARIIKTEALLYTIGGIRIRKGVHKNAMGRPLRDVDLVNVSVFPQKVVGHALPFCVVKSGAIIVAPNLDTVIHVAPVTVISNSLCRGLIQCSHPFLGNKAISVDLMRDQHTVTSNGSRTNGYDGDDSPRCQPVTG